MFAMDKLLTPAEAAAILGISKFTLDGWRLSKERESPPHVKLSERTIRYRLADLIAWIETNVR